eukprot:6489047-Amphidinium_carterae.1
MRYRHENHLRHHPKDKEPQTKPQALFAKRTNSILIRFRSQNATAYSLKRTAKPPTKDIAVG